MSEIKKSTKKLTDAGASVVVLGLIAFVLSVAGTLIEPIAVSLYNSNFSSDVKNFLADDVISFLKVYEHPIIFTVLSLVVVVSSISAVNKKKIGAGFCVMSLVLPIVTAINPVVSIGELLTSGTFSDAFNNGTDGDKFRAVVSLSVDALPVFAAFFLLLCGVILTGKILSEEFKVEVPYAKRMPVMPEVQKPVIKEKVIDEKKVSDVQPQFEFTHDIIDDSAFKKPEGNAKSVSAEISYDAKVDNEVVKEDIKPATTDENISSDNSSDTIICKECGNELAADAKFCKNCGRPVF